MRYGIFSDVHSNIEAFDKVIEEFKKEDISQYLFAGDIVGYAASPNECVKRLISLSPVAVAGNHDQAAVGLFSLDFFNEIAAEAIIWARRILSKEARCFLETQGLIFKNKDLALAHGTLDDPQEFHYLTDGFIAEDSFRLMDTDVCFVGHTHFPGIFIKDESGHIGYSVEAMVKIKPGCKYIVNTGSVGQPRDRNPQACYCVYDTDKRQILTKRVSYDVDLAARKIFDAELPRFLGERLFTGR